MRWLLLATLLLLCSAVQADTALDGVVARLQHSEVLRGEFAQERRIEGFSNPLRSSGRFLLSREHGVVWRSERPFASTLVIDRAGLRLDGATQAVPDLALRRVQALLLALIGGDLAALQGEFSLQAEIDDAGWTLHAEAHDALLAERLRGLRLRGDRWVDEVEFLDQQGNRTTIRFTAQQPEPASLSADERAAFD